MESSQWVRIEHLFHQAADLVPAERSAFLDRVCGDDAALRHELETLLAADIPQESLIEAAVDSSVAALPADPDESCELIGKRVGPYSIVGLIGTGGMGSVYRAVREDDFRMQVAIKLLKRGTDTDAALSRFRIERQILAGLQHPNIARLLDGGATETGLPFFVMELVDGTPLLEYAAPLPIRRRLELFRSVCSAVHNAHQNRVVHRDIKPANILVTPEGIPKLLDFGIARLLDPEVKGSGTAPTADGMRLMTPDYASPEQLRGQRITAATDIYSLGLVLYELLTGERAHHVKRPSADGPKKRRAVTPHLDPDLDNIVRMATREEPGKRYASVEELANDIDRFLGDLPVHARKENRVYRGRKFLKRHRALIAVAALSPLIVWLLVAGFGQMRKPSGGMDAGIRSIAVLPLENLSGDRDQEYLSDGITDALISDLARIGALRVISRTSVMSYKGVRRRLPEIAHSLGVQTIAEGSVLRSGTRVRIAVRLFDAPADRPVWSGSYEGDLKDVLALQQQVVGAIAGEIHVRLTAPNQARVHTRPVDLGAYDAYLKGRHQYLTEFNQESVQKAIALFQHALALDPGYAQAYAGLADCYYIVSNQYYPPSEMMPKARAAALKAIELDDTLGEAHATLALVRSLYEYNFAEGEKGFRRAIELMPSDAEAHLWYGLHLTGMGRFDEAGAEVELARKLDPVSPSLNGYLGALLYYQHRYDEVIQRMQPIVQMYPDYQQPYAWLALAYEQKGEWAKAITAMEKSNSLDADQVDGLAQLGHMYALAGRTSDARRMLSQLKQVSRRRYVTVWDFALLHAGLGEPDEAFRWLQKAEADRSEMFALLKVDPRFDTLHSDPRFATLLRRVGLSP